jgi:hypothetical protein
LNPQVKVGLENLSKFIWSLPPLKQIKPAGNIHGWLFGYYSPLLMMVTLGSVITCQIPLLFLGHG